MWNVSSSDIGYRRDGFEGSRKPLVQWFRAIWWMTNEKNGASALGLQRVLGLGSYQTAWAWLHKLRRAMVRPGRELLALIAIAAEENGNRIGRIRMARKSLFPYTESLRTKPPYDKRARKILYIGV
jgi:hypothetical protein